jgi:hypothetical protein
MPLFEHWSAPGVHTPVHAPVTHAEAEHVTGVLHWPSVPHVSMPLFEHCLAPGAHTPVHVPLAQALFEHAVPSCQVPVSSQVWGV